VESFQKALNAVKNRDRLLEDWEIKSIQTWWKGYSDHICFHCQNEDACLNPILNKRFRVSTDKLQKDHHELLNKHWDNLNQLVVVQEQRQTIRQLGPNPQGAS
jgi:hemerythrin-like domain-containing protein